MSSFLFRELKTPRETMIAASAVTALGVEEKISGRYGHGKVQLRGFAGRLMPSLNVVAFRGARQRAGGNRALSGARGHAPSARSSVAR